MTLLRSLPAAACVAWAHIRGKPRSLPTSCILAVTPASLPEHGPKGSAGGGDVASVGVGLDDL